MIIYLSSSDFKLSTEGPISLFHVAAILLLYIPEKDWRKEFEYAMLSSASVTLTS